MDLLNYFTEESQEALSIIGQKHNEIVGLGNPEMGTMTKDTSQFLFPIRSRNSHFGDYVLYVMQDAICALYDLNDGSNAGFFRDSNRTSLIYDPGIQTSYRFEDDDGNFREKTMPRTTLDMLVDLFDTE